MKDDHNNNVYHQPGRLRGKAWICFLLGGTGCVAAIIGAIQYYRNGWVTIRPGHPGVQGEAALELLTVLSVISLFCVAYGMLLGRRAKT